MPQLTFTPAAIRDLERLRNFLRPKNPEASRRAGDAIRQGVKLLAEHPQAGRPVEGLPAPFREWLIEFGDSGYVLRYRLTEEQVVILRLRHQREAGYD